MNEGRNVMSNTPMQGYWKIKMQPFGTVGDQIQSRTSQFKIMICVCVCVYISLSLYIYICSLRQAEAKMIAPLNDLLKLRPDGHMRPACFKLGRAPCLQLNYLSGNPPSNLTKRWPTPAQPMPNQAKANQSNLTKPRSPHSTLFVLYWVSVKVASGLYLLRVWGLAFTFLVYGERTSS